MKHHIMIAFGLLMAAVYGYRLANAILEPGVGLRELYLLGGLVIAAWLIHAGLKERRHARSLQKDPDPES